MSFTGREVANSSEFRRIVAIPRRAPEISDEIVREMTSVLRTPRGTMSLRPVQALALHDLGLHGGLAAPIGVGGGKTLISLLAPYVLGLKRPLLLLPAALIEKTEKERRELSRHWLIPRNLRLESYERLGRVAAAKFLEQWAPDGIIMDEAHRLKNPKAACTRRVARYVKEHPETKVVAMSGTFMKRSLRDFAALLEWALGDNAPVPLTDGELEEWCCALDEKVNPLSRLEPGPLGPTREAAREWYQRRLLETPGVVAMGAKDDVSASLYVRSLAYDVGTDEQFARLRDAWERSDGWALSQAVDIWRHARELALGMCYVWDPLPPEEWLNARREWAKFVRETIKYSKTLDSELHVASACDRDELPSGELRRWREVRPSFTIESKPIWHDDGALRACEEWAMSNRGIVWVEHGFFGRELARRTGIPYYRAGGQDVNGNPIEAEKGDRPVIASIASCGTGRNLQMFSKNLVTSVPQGADAWEQLLGRTHRTGQTADTVEVDVLRGCAEHHEGFMAASADAAALAATLGQPQKLCLADICWDETKGSGPRWNR